MYGRYVCSGDASHARSLMLFANISNITFERYVKSFSLNRTQIIRYHCETHTTTQHTHTHTQHTQREHTIFCIYIISRTIFGQTKINHKCGRERERDVEMHICCYRILLASLRPCTTYWHCSAHCWDDSNAQYAVHICIWICIKWQQMCFCLCIRHTVAGVVIVVLDLCIGLSIDNLVAIYLILMGF